MNPRPAYVDLYKYNIDFFVEYVNIFIPAMLVTF